jgi:hypothetical protein
VKQGLLHRADRTRLGVEELVALQLHRQPVQALSGLAQRVIQRAEAVECSPGVTGDHLDELLGRSPGDLFPASPLDFEEQVIGQRRDAAPNLDP